MSVHNKMSKNFSSDEFEEKNGKNKSVMEGSPSLDLNQSLEEPDLELNLNSADVKLNRPQASEPQPDKNVVGEEEPEYSCNFCTKKFLNKQALGGHQNAHKLEKVGLKRARQGQMANFGYTGNGFNNGFSSFTFPNSFEQVPKMMKGSLYPYMDHQVHAHEYPGSMFPMSHESGGVQPLMGFGGFGTIPNHPPKPQMQARDHPGSVFPMSNESGVLQPLMALNRFCTNPANPPNMSSERWMGQGATANPPNMSSERWMGQGASTSKGRSIAAAKNDEVGPSKEINDTEIQDQEDDLDLSLKL